MEKLTEKTALEFTEVLASKAPVPGGGGVSAFVGAYGIALGAMAGNLTLGRKKYAEFEEENLVLLKKANELQERLLDLVDADAEAFEPLSKAYSMPKDDPSYEETMEKVTVGAIQAPMEMMRCAANSVEILERLQHTCSVLMISDVGCGAICCKAAMEAASLNVFVNTKILKNREIAGIYDKEAERLLAEYGPRAQSVADAVTERLHPNVQIVKE